MTNFKAASEIPEDKNWEQRHKFLWEAAHYVWEDSYLFKIGGDSRYSLAL
jgi:hypothetical protein